MHVAINAAFWNQPNTGSGQYTRQLVYHLNRLVSDLTITLIYPQVVGGPEPEDVPPSVNVKLVTVRPGNMGKVWFEQRLFPRACQEVGATVAHVPYWGGPLQSPVPLVVTVHDLTTLLVPEYRRPLRTRLYNALVATSARGATRIITDSDASKQDIVEHLHIPADKIERIYLAAGSQFSTQDSGLLEMAVLRKYDLPEFYVLYLGGYELHKNVTTLLLAWTYVGQALGEDYPLVLAGKKPTQANEIYPDYDHYIKQLGIEEYVRWIGYVDEEDKPMLYRNAETFVFPSRREGFGLGVLEAMACGTPVVTTTATSLPEVVGDAGFAVEPDDARNMAGAIISTIIQDNLRAELRQKGEQQAANFSWEKTATETLLVYDEVVGKP
ncbi:glycosyltransferase family 4 protein [Candidatus Leptofilum sp.]|uniref:glycosyltransferase family 4 protein n=1 Tax=Candidatus Leptofilum sp. TaxID=3241576 RepID=UPI003B5B9485